MGLRGGARSKLGGGDGRSDHGGRHGRAAAAGIITRTTPGTVAENGGRLVQAGGRGDRLFPPSTTARGPAARSRVHESIVVIFGSPVAGGHAPVMQASPLAALDLPLRVLVWDEDGRTRISYTDPEALTTSATTCLPT